MPRDDRWTHLVNAAFRLSEATAGVDDRAARERTVAEILDSAIEVFPSSVDPMGDFEGFAVRRLLLALRESLESREP